MRIRLYLWKIKAVSYIHLREGRNPQTGETMKIEASKAPKFKAGKALKDMVNA